MSTLVRSDNPVLNKLVWVLLIVSGNVLLSA